MLDKEWWKQEREPAVEMVITKKRKIASKYFSVKEVSARFGVSADRVYDYIWSGELCADVFGKGYCISEEALQDFLNNCAQKKRKTG